MIDKLIHLLHESNNQAIKRNVTDGHEAIRHANRECIRCGDDGIPDKHDYLCDPCYIEEIRYNFSKKVDDMIENEDY